MNTFTLKRYNTADNKWYNVPNLVFPLGTGDFLDERLDEAYVTFYDDTPHYESGTIFKVLLTENTESSTFYYVLDSDSSINIKVGAELYRHTLHLLEPTKLTEGVLCQTISFTNELGSDGSKSNAYSIPYFAPTDIDYSTIYPAEAVRNEFLYLSPTLDIKAVYKKGTTVSLPSIEEVADLFLRANQQSGDIDGAYVQLLPNGFFDPITAQYEKPRLTVIEGTTTTVTENYNERLSYAFNSGAAIILSYRIAWKLGTAANFSVINFRTSASMELLPTLPYTITSMTNRCLKLAEPLFLSSGRYTPRFKFEGCGYTPSGAVYIAPPATGEDPSQGYIYDKVFADEITLSGATLREQLKGIARLIHAEPRVYITEAAGSAPDVSYLNFWVRYDKYGVQTEATLNKPYSYRALSQSINEYCTKIRTNAANLVNSLDYAVGVVTDPLPADNQFSVRSLRTDTTGVRIGADNGIAETANPIYKITRVECGIMDSNNIYRLPLTDITAFVVERAAYELLTSYGTTYPEAKAYALYYTQGEQNIQGLFFRAVKDDNVTTQIVNYYAICNILALATGRGSGAVNDLIATYGEASLVFRVTYIPMYSTTLAHSKQLWRQGEIPYAQIYAQSENIIEAQYYGENVKGTAAKLGNVSEERTYILNRRSDAPKVGQMLDGYSVASVSCETFPDFTKCTVALSKDYNRINEYVGINSHKRIYEVSEREAYSRDVLLNEYIVFSKDAELYSDNGCILPTAALAVSGLSGNQINQISNVVCDMKNGSTVLSRVSLPVISSAFGNAMVFTWKYRDNFSAGQASEYVTAQDVRGRWGVNVAYADKYGRADAMAFWLFSKSIVSGGSEYAYYTPDIKDHTNDLEPLTEAVISTQNSGNYVILKDSRETINTVNYELEFRTTESDLIIGSALAGTNPLVTSQKRYYIYALKSKPNKFLRKLDISDVVTDGGNPVQVAIERIEVVGGISHIIFPNNNTGRHIYWALATELVELTRGPFVFPDGDTGTVTEWTGGEVVLAGTNLVGPGEVLYPDLYVTVHH